MLEADRRIPEQFKDGVLVTDPTDQTVVKDDLRKHGEQAKDWEYHEQHQYLHRWATLFKDRLLDPVLLTDRGRMPDPVISFDKMRVEALAAYMLVRNPQGLLDEITFNSVHFVDGQWRYGEWGLLETELHEEVHLWQQNFGKDPIRLGRVYHNAEFVAKCESFGLHPRLGVGAHWKPADGVFAQIMAEHGIEKPPEIEAEGRMDWWKLLQDLLGKEKLKGKSSLHHWQCDCGQNIRVGKKEWPGATCLKCGSDYHKVENGVPLVLLDAKKEENGK
jgi:hypothetical protein